MRIYWDKFLRNKIRVLKILVFSLWFLVLFTISIAAPVIPLNGDEAANYLQFSRFGPIYPIFHYEAPNNHVFFTILQSLLIPKQALQFLPIFPRILNVIVGGFFFLFLFFIIKKLFKENYILWIFITISCFFISPLVTPYFIVARGYLLGLTLLIMGIYLLTNEKFYLSSILFILSGWTLPTYAYALPFVYTSALFVFPNSKKKLTLLAILTVLILLFCYLPILGQMLYLTSAGGYNSLWEFLSQTLSSITNFSYIKFGNILNYGYILVFIIGILSYLRENGNKTPKKFITFLISAILSYIIIICALSPFHVNEPFLRNGLFIPAFVLIINLLVAVLTKNNILKLIIFILLFLNILTGAYIFISDFVSPQSKYPLFEGEFHPRDSTVLASIMDKKIEYSSLSESMRNKSTVRYYYSIYYPSSLLAFKSNEAGEDNVASQSADISKITFNDIGIIPENNSKYCGKEPVPYILPTNKLYVLEKLFQNISVRFIDFFDYSKKYTIRYLLKLSDNTYAEADYLWRSGNYSLAINTASRAENYMSIVGLNTNILSVRKQKDQKLFVEIEASICLHKKILQNIMESEHGKENKQLSNIIYFFKSNYQTVQSIKN